MGLPLFVAPVESDVTSRSGEKPTSTSPPRSNIRRHAASDSRERRATTRRHDSIRNQLGYTFPTSFPASSNLPPITFPDQREDSTRHLPWVESGFPPDYERPGTQASREASREPSLRARPFREALREMANGEERRRERWSGQVNPLFGDWQEDETGSAPDDDEQTELAFRRSRRIRYRDIIAPTSPRPHSILPAASGAMTEARGGYPTRDGRDGTRVMRSEWDLDGRLRWSENDTVTNRPGRRGEDRGQRFDSTRPRGPGVDGLGDRDRSVSPDVWDTLLNTLTPDPQPPSVGSSFVSAAVSQSAGGSSSTSITDPEAIDGPVADVNTPCDSGQENSDSEGPDYEHPDFARIRRRRDEIRRVRLRVPASNRDGPVEGPFSRRRGAATTSSSRRRESPLIFQDGVPLAGPLPPPRPQRRPSAWFARLYESATDEDQRARRQSFHRENFSSLGTISSATGHHDLPEMERIVRSLARRDDISDEWWADMGLSRTHPRDE